MGGNAERVKERLDIAEVIGGYVKLEKAGANFKARCPFHTEKTPSFLVSTSRQGYYCFGCGAKGDIFTFVEEMEGVDFKEALKLLADRAGIELEFGRGADKTESDKLKNILLDATEFFERGLKEEPEALKYLESRGVSKESVKTWRIGWAPDEWRALHYHLTALGHSEDLLLKAGLIRKGESGKSPYDVFRGRVIFPLSDASGNVIAFSGRALAKDAVAKYLNSPDTLLFNKSQVLYGLDKAKSEIRKKDYAVLVEGQMDLVLSHQAGVGNTVAASGTAFTAEHLERLKKLSSRIILAFDGDSAGSKAALKSTELALALGMEVKVASMPDGKDPAELASESADAWKDVLRKSEPAIEYFLNKIIEKEKDPRKAGKHIEKIILPLIALVPSAIERSHFVSYVAKGAGIREEVIWEDLRRSSANAVRRNTPLPPADSARSASDASAYGDDSRQRSPLSHREVMEERLEEIRLWRKEFPGKSDEAYRLEKEEAELIDNLQGETLREELQSLLSALARAERGKEEAEADRLSKEIKGIHEKIAALEDKRKRM